MATKAALISEVTANFPDNTAGSITPSILRSTTIDGINSWQQSPAINAQTAGYTVVQSDYGQCIVVTSAAPVTVVLPAASTAGFFPFNVMIKNAGTGSVTVSPASGTIDGIASFVLTTNQSAWAISDGTNWRTGFSTASVAGVVGGNPTALVGLTAVNGTSSNYVRADGAPALDVTIAPTWSGAHQWTAAVTFGAAIYNTGIITPPQITGNLIDYNPTGLSTANVLRLSTSAQWNLTGLQAGTTGRMIKLINVGSFPLVITNNDTNSTAANRFALSANITLNTNEFVDLWYDVVLSRWLLGLGSAAMLNAGSGAGNVVQLDASGRLPAVDGSLLTSLPATASVLGGLPGGRITLQSGVPVMNSSSAGATTVYYAPYLHQFVPIWNGSLFAMTNIGGQLSQTTADATKSPAAAVANKNYDLFVWNDGGTIRCTRGFPWTSDTARGTGAGTAQIGQLNGVYVNSVAITNGPAANFGTYVGTIRANASAQVDFILGSVGAAASFGVWNMYNRVSVTSFSAEATASWTYASNVTRAMNNSSIVRSSFVRGLDEDCVQATLNAMMQDTVGAANALTRFNIGLDATNVAAASNNQGLGFSTGAAGFVACVVSTYGGFPGLGFHFLQGLETGDNTHNNTIYGTPYNGFTTSLRM